MTKKKDELVPYGQVSPGFEAAYTGETSSTSVQETELITTLHSDENGNLIRQWSTIPWTFPGKEGEWDDTVKHLHEMQIKLGPLTDNIRQIRAHITGLIPCDSGLPVTVDEVLFAIARGKLERSSFRNGCLCSGIGCQLKTSQPQQMESSKTIHAVLNAYLAGEPKQNAIKAHSEAAGFINRSYQWLGAVSELSKVQRKMLDRMLLMIDFLAHTSVTTVDIRSWSSLEMSELQDMAVALGKDLFTGEDGRGARLDAEIADQAGLPKIHPNWDPAYRETLEKLKDKPEQELYKTCCAIASGIQTLSDCHHNTFRYVENWIHGIGKGHMNIPTRKGQTEKQRLGHLLFGYALGLDRWLQGVPMQFLLLDLGHTDLGFDPKNEILRVYASLGKEVTAIKQWLAACLWYNLYHNEQGGLVTHTELVQRCQTKRVNAQEWMSSVLPSQSQEKQ